MIRYLAGYLGYGCSLLAGLLVLTFVLFHVVPSDPARTILGPNASEQEVGALRHELGLDHPLTAQLVDFAGKVARFDFGHSFVDRRSVAGEVRDKLAVSAALVAIALVALVLYVAAVVVIEVGLGWRLEFVDTLLVATPTIFSGVVLALVAARFLSFGSFSGHLADPADWLALVPPAVALAVAPMALQSRLVRGELRELRHAPYVRTARAFGFSERRIVWSWMIPNALAPALGALSAQLPALFTGAFIVEVIFSLPGAGSLMLRSILGRDLPMLEALVLVNGLVVIGLHVGFELLHAIVDPRVARGGPRP